MCIRDSLKGIDWLKRHYKDHRVHAVNFPGDPYPIHIDCLLYTSDAADEGLGVDGLNIYATDLC